MTDRLTIDDLKAFIRSGGYVWPGGYPCALLLSGGGIIDAQAARANFQELLREIKEPSFGSGSRPVGMHVHYEGPPIICAFSGRLIESAYGDPREE